jgi:hypothetical protein
MHKSSHAKPASMRSIPTKAVEAGLGGTASGKMTQTQQRSSHMCHLAAFSQSQHLLLLTNITFLPWAVFLVHVQQLEYLMRPLPLRQIPSPPS